MFLRWFVKYASCCCCCCCCWCCDFCAAFSIACARHISWFCIGMATLRTWGWPSSRPRLITWLPLPSGAARCSDAAGPLFTYGERPCRKRQYKNGRCKDCVLAKYLLNRCLKFGVLTGDILVHLGRPFGWWCRNLLWAKHIESWDPCLKKVWSHQIDPCPVMFAQLVDLLMVESTCFLQWRWKLIDSDSQNWTRFR